LPFTDDDAMKQFFNYEFYIYLSALSLFSLFGTSTVFTFTSFLFILIFLEPLQFLLCSGCYVALVQASLALNAFLGNPFGLAILLSMLVEDFFPRSKRIVIHSTSEEGKAFVHANCVFVHETTQVNESGFSLECCIWFC
jgi:hypothetical protein